MFDFYSLFTVKLFLKKKFTNYIDPYNHKNYRIKENERLNKVKFTCYKMKIKQRKRSKYVIIVSDNEMLRY